MIVTILTMSDTHNQHGILSNIPDADILVHAGDLTGQGRPFEIEEVCRWFKTKLSDGKFKDVVFISGNHDFGFQEAPERMYQFYKETAHLHYLKDSQVTIQGVTIYGVPWNPWFYDWAWNLKRGSDEMKAVWKQLPENVDLLLTHSPPRGYLDVTRSGEAVGCEDMLEAIVDKKPKVVVCGHIHEAAGSAKIEATDTWVVNTAICNRDYRPKQRPYLIKFNTDTHTVESVEEV